MVGSGQIQRNFIGERSAGRYSCDLYKNFNEINDQRALAIFALVLKHGAMTWYLGQSAVTKAGWTQLQTAFKERYFPQVINPWKQTAQLWSMKQCSHQLAVDFMSAFKVEAGRAKIMEDQLRFVVVQGLLPHVLQFVVTREGSDANSLRKWLALAHAAAEPDPKDHISSAFKYIQR